MLGGHIYELVIVLIIALVVFGPKRLPELGSSLGKGIREFRKATTDLQDSIRTDTAGNLPPEQPTYTNNSYSAPQHTSAEFTATGASSSTSTPRQDVEPRV
jgi:sec-independent protein translocase protein TatA